jgi:hypothetical protein
MKNAHETKAARYTVHTSNKDMKMLFWREKLLRHCVSSFLE